MAAYNAEKYIKDAIQSILNQTFTDFELIIVNDGSTDGTKKIINSFEDKRIRYYENERNEGIVFTRNRLLKLVNSTIIAWLDADDIAIKERLEIQFNFLEKNEKIVFCGSWAEIINKEGKQLNETWKPISSIKAIPLQMLFTNNFITSSVMMRNLGSNQPFFTERFPLAEDFYLWHQYLKFGQATNIKMPLIFYRTHNEGATHIGNELMESCKENILLEEISQLGWNLNQEEKENYLSLVFNRPLDSKTVYNFCKKAKFNIGKSADLNSILLERYTKNQIRNKKPKISDIYWLFKMLFLLSFQINFPTLQRIVLIFLQSIFHKNIFKTS